MPHLEDEFSPSEVNDDATPHLDFEFINEMPPLSDYVLVPPVRVCKESYRVNQAGLTYHVFPQNGCWRILVKSNRLSKIKRFTPDFVARISHWNYLTPSETIAKNFMYNVFDHLSQIANLQLGQSYLHASSFERQGRGVAIVAWTGIGKSTSMLKLVMEDGWRYLSDDLSVIDDSGTLWRLPKRMQIYGYNVAGQRHLYKALMHRRSLIDRASWKGKLWLNGPDGVRRRVGAEEFFGPTRVASKAKLTRVFFIERWDVNDLIWRPIGLDELARRAALIIVKEIEPFGMLSAAMHATGYHPLLQTPDDIFRRTFEVLTNAFRGVKAELLMIPLRTGPDALAEYLRERLNREDA